MKLLPELSKKDELHFGTHAITLAALHRAGIEVCQSYAFNDEFFQKYITLPHINEVINSKENNVIARLHKNPLPENLEELLRNTWDSLPKGEYTISLSYELSEERHYPHVTKTASNSLEFTAGIVSLFNKLLSHHHKNYSDLLLPKCAFILSNARKSASYSGECYTIHPVTHRRNIVLIDAKNNRNSDYIHAVLGKSDGINKYSITEGNSIPEGLLQEVYEKSKKISELSTSPIAFSFSFEKYLQITSVYFPVGKSLKIFEPLWFCLNSFDGFPRTFTPLSESFIRKLLNESIEKIAHELQAELPNNWGKIVIQKIEGALYLNVSLVESLFEQIPGGRKSLLGFLDPKRTFGHLKNPFSQGKILSNSLKLLPALITGSTLLKRKVYNYKVTGGESLESYIAQAEELSTYYTHLVMYLLILRWQLYSIFKPHHPHAHLLVEQLFSINPELRIHHPVIQVRNLAKKIAMDEHARSLMVHTEYIDFVQISDKENPLTNYVKEFHELVERFGHRAHHELELTEPRWREAPHHLYYLLKQCVTTPCIDGELPENLGLAYQFRKLSFFEKPVARQVLDRCQNILESSEYCRNLLLKVLEKIREKTVVQNQESSLYNLEELLQNKKPDDSILSSRKEEYEYFSKSPYPQPKFVGDEMPEYCPPRFHKEKNILGGHALFQGIKKGTVLRYREDLSSQDLTSDTVLLCHHPDIDIDRLLPYVGALISDRGYILSETTTLCRSLELPTVFHLKNATELLKDGDTVTVDGIAGKVYINTEKKL